MQSYPSEHVHGHSPDFRNFRPINLKLGMNVLNYNTLPCFEKFGSTATGRLFVGMTIFTDVDKEKLLLHKSRPKIAINIVMQKLPPRGSRTKVFKTRESLVMKYVHAKFQVDRTKIAETC